MLLHMLSLNQPQLNFVLQTAFRLVKDDESHSSSALSGALLSFRERKRIAKIASSGDAATVSLGHYDKRRVVYYYFKNIILYTLLIFF